MLLLYRRTQDTLVSIPILQFVAVMRIRYLPPNLHQPITNKDKENMCDQLSITNQFLDITKTPAKNPAYGKPINLLKVCG